MNNSLKVVSLILIMILMLVPFSTLAKDMTKESLDSGLSSVKEELEDKYIKSYVVNDDNYTITFDESNESNTVGYKFESGSATFSNSIKIDNTTTYADYLDLSGSIMQGLDVGFMATAVTNGQTAKDAEAYFLLEILNNLDKMIDTSNTLKYVIIDDNTECEAGTTSTCIKKSEFSKYAVEYADSSLNEYKITDSNNLFTLETKKVKEENSLTYSYELKVNTNGDFTLINGSYDKLKKSFEDTIKEIQDQMNNNKINNQTTVQTLRPTDEEIVKVPNTAKSTDKYVITAGISLFIIGCYLIINVIVKNNKILN